MKIVSRYDSTKILFDAEADSIMQLVEKAIKSGADLTRADLTGADLTRADLTGADLTWANLTGANLTGANLTGADLTRANLTGADLTRADLTGANLTGANLTWADLTRADLTGANLTRANLTGADLTRADLTGANLTWANLNKDQGLVLVEPSPVFQITPIGSRSATLVAFNTNEGIFIKTGCFFGELDKFCNAVKETHASNTHAKQYAAAIELIKVMFEEGHND